MGFYEDSLPFGAGALLSTSLLSSAQQALLSLGAPCARAAPTPPSIHPLWWVQSLAHSRCWGHAVMHMEPTAQCPAPGTIQEVLDTANVVMDRRNACKGILFHHLLEVYLGPFHLIEIVNGHLQVTLSFATSLFHLCPDFLFLLPVILQLQKQEKREEVGVEGESEARM